MVKEYILYISMSTEKTWKPNGRYGTRGTYGKCGREGCSKAIAHRHLEIATGRGGLSVCRGVMFLFKVKGDETDGVDCVVLVWPGVGDSERGVAGAESPYRHEVSRALRGG